MARNKRRRGFYRPAIAAAEPALTELAGAESAQIWARGEQHEESFDYEAAHQHYREAVRRASASNARHWLSQYAAFLVERYGQFPEVAAWLDDAEFDPLDGATSKGGLTLPRLVLSAAMETGHPRAAELDERLAREFGEPESLGRVADQLLQRGLEDEAQTLLEAHEARLPALSRGAQLLTQLRQNRDAACEVALDGVTRALAAHDVASARAALEQQRDAWASEPRFKATEVHVAAAEAEAHAERLRARIEAHLDANELAAAVEAARTLHALNPAHASDKATLDALERQLTTETLAADLAAAANAATEARLTKLVEVYATHGGDVTVPEPLAAAWGLVAAAFAALPAPVVRAEPEQLVHIAALRDAVAQRDLPQMERLLAALTGPWRDVETARTAAELVATAAREAAQAEEQRRANLIRTELQAGRLREAAQLLEAWPSELTTDGGALLKTLRKELQEGQRRRQQRERLGKEVAASLAAGRLFAARRALATLEGVDELGEEMALRWQDELDERCMTELCGSPVPPFGLTLEQAAVACTVVGQRLLIVQNRTWLAVNLETRGVAPFQLPEGFPLEATPTPQLGTRDDRARLIALSGGRLVTIEQDGGEAPEVTNARSLSELTRGEGHVLSWALEPAADVIALLFAKNGDRGGPTLIRIDADTLDAISHERVKPALAGITGVRGAPETLLATTTIDARRRQGWAVARFGAETVPEKTWSQDEVAEPVASFNSAIAWPEEDRVYAGYDTFDMFDAAQVQRTPSLFVMRGDRIVFASSDLRKRFAPMERIIIDHAWTLDPTAGRLWFAALPREDHGGKDAMLLGINARSLRPDAPVSLDGVARVLAINAVSDGAAALCRTHEGRHAVARARVDDRGQFSLTIDALPV